MALKAGLVNNPPNDEEGRLYREIGRSKFLPQGICVINSACKVLAWAEMFDDDKSVLAFLDHCSQRFAQFPGAQAAIPRRALPEVPEREGPRCPGQRQSPGDCRTARQREKLSGKATSPTRDDRRSAVRAGARQRRQTRGRHPASRLLRGGPLPCARRDAGGIGEGAQRRRQRPLPSGRRPGAAAREPCVPG